MDWEREAIGPLEMSLMPHCSHPANFNQVGHHDDGSCVLLPHHPPEVAERLGQRALRGHVGVLLAVAVDVVGVDVV